MSPNPDAQPEQTQPGRDADAEPANQRGPRVSPMDLLDKFCCLQAGRSDISLKPAP